MIGFSWQYFYSGGVDCNTKALAIKILKEFNLLNPVGNYSELIKYIKKNHPNIDNLVGDIDNEIKYHNDAWGIIL